MVFEKVREILASQLEIDEDRITPDTDLVKDLSADSLDVVEMIMAIEEEYGIVITDESIHGFTTVRDVAEFIESLL